jgi:hypothetical protein
MAPIAIKYGANEKQRNFYLNEMSNNNINFRKLEKRMEK